MVGACLSAGLQDLVSVVAEAPQAGADSVLGPAGEGDDGDDDMGDDAAADGEDASDSEEDGDAAMADADTDTVAQVLLACWWLCRAVPV